MPLADLLVPVIEERPSLGNGGDLGPTFDRAVERVRSRLFGDIEAQCRDYTDRLGAKSALSADTEWEAWAAMRCAADRLLELAPEVENTLFQIMYVPACNFAVFQQNIHKRRALAHDIYTWLHKHSHSDASAVQLLLRNVRASKA